MGMELSNGRHELLEAGRLGISIVGIPLAVFVDQHLEVAERIRSRRFECVEDERMHQHALHPLDQTIPPMRRQEIVAAAAGEAHCG